MKHVVAFCISTLFSAFCLVAQTTSPGPTVGPKLTIEAPQGRNAKLSFPTAVNRRYQVYFSPDLIRWEFAGSVTNGTGQNITIEDSPTGKPNGYYKVLAADRAASVPLKIQIHEDQLKTKSLENRSVDVSFSTLPGSKYLMYSSSDLVHWAVLSDLIEGTGQRISLEFDTDQDARAFFRAETALVLPLPDMVRIPPGTFVMGSPVTEKDRDLDEDPLTNVTLSYGFWMGKYEVTQREYEAIMGSNPSWFKGDPNRPVEQVTWKDATAYCARLTEIEQAAGRLPAGYAYRLPTEAEFEYACRAGTATRFSFGDDPDYTQLGQFAWYGDNSANATHPVGQKTPNPFGLYDIYGNVWEWCLDWYQDPYPGGNVINPSGPGLAVSRVFRGGGWDYVAASCRSAYRNNVAPTRRTNYLGFRVVLSPFQP